MDRYHPPLLVAEVFIVRSRAHVNLLALATTMGASTKLARWSSLIMELPP
jgi:hypothetical protein